MCVRQVRRQTISIKINSFRLVITNDACNCFNECSHDQEFVSKVLTNISQFRWVKIKQTSLCAIGHIFDEFLMCCMSPFLFHFAVQVAWIQARTGGRGESENGRIESSQTISPLHEKSWTRKNDFWGLNEVSSTRLRADFMPFDVHGLSDWVTKLSSPSSSLRVAIANC